MSMDGAGGEMVLCGPLAATAVVVGEQLSPLLLALSVGMTAAVGAFSCVGGDWENHDRLAVTLSPETTTEVSIELE